MRRALLLAALVLLALVAAIGLVARRMLDREAVRSALEQQASAVIGHPVKVASVDWALSMRPRLVLSSIRVGEPPAITVDRIELTTGLRALLSKRVAGAGIVVSGSHLTLPLPIAFAADTPPAPGGAAGPGRRSHGVCHRLESIASRSKTSSSTRTDRRLRLDLESSLEGDRLTVSSLRLQSDRTKVTARGEMVSLGATPRRVYRDGRSARSRRVAGDRLGPERASSACDEIRTSRAGSRRPRSRRSTSAWRSRRHAAASWASTSRISPRRSR